jgi:hypothetical protein
MSLLCHRNSLASWRSLNPAARTQAILAVYRGSMAPLTDREVAERLGFTEMNAVRPRITELIKAQLVTEVYDVPDHVTGKKVRSCTSL